jgi:hypothetical protein
MRATGPVNASKPVASTSVSKRCARPPATSPAGVMAAIGCAFTSTSATLGRLNVS